MKPLFLIWTLIFTGCGKNEFFEFHSDPLHQMFDPHYDGPYSYRKSFEHSYVESYESGVVYEPIGKGKWPAVTLSGGLNNSKEDVDWLAKRLASHGFIVLAFTPHFKGIADRKHWSRGHVGAIYQLFSLNDWKESPFHERIRKDRLGIIGYSMGGSGVIDAAKRLGKHIKSAVSVNAYYPPRADYFDAAALFIAGKQDSLALPYAIRKSYNSLYNKPKAFVSINQLSHTFGNAAPYEKAKITRFMLSWLHYHLNDKKQFRDYFTGYEKDQSIHFGMVDRDNILAVF